MSAAGDALELCAGDSDRAREDRWLRTDAPHKSLLRIIQGVRLREPGLSRRFSAGTGQAQQELLAPERAIDRRRSDAAQFQADGRGRRTLEGIATLRC